MKKKTRKVKVPVDKGAAALLLDNPVGNVPFGNGTITFAPDGWIKDGKGKNLQKYFTNISDGGTRIRIWEPSLENIPALEAFMVKCYEKMKENFESGAWGQIWKEIKAKKIKKAFFEHNGEWGYIEFNEDEQMGWTYGTRWVNSEAKFNPAILKEKHVNTEFYQRFKAADKRYGELSNRHYIAQKVFHEAMKRKLWFIRPKKMKEYGRLLQVNVNGRVYMYVATNYERSSAMYWKFLYDSGNKPEVLDIG